MVSLSLVLPFKDASTLGRVQTGRTEAMDGMLPRHALILPAFIGAAVLKLKD